MNSLPTPAPVAFDRAAGVGVQRGWARPDPRFSPDTIDRVAWILAAVGSPDDSERSERPLDMGVVARTLPVPSWRFLANTDQQECHEADRHYY